MDLAAEKKALRRELKQKRKNLLESYRHKADRQILERVKSLELFRQAHRIFCYVSMAEEVDTWQRERSWQFHCAGKRE